MVNVLVKIAFWITLAGFVTFIPLYAILARPWRTSMGRHFIAFMSGLCLALLYAVVGRIIKNHDLYLYGWVGVYCLLSFLIWGQVVLLIKYQIQARREQ